MPVIRLCHRIVSRRSGSRLESSPLVGRDPRLPKPRAAMTPAPKGYQATARVQRPADPPACPQGSGSAVSTRPRWQPKGLGRRSSVSQRGRLAIPSIRNPCIVGASTGHGRLQRRPGLINRRRCMFAPARGPCQARRAFQRLVELMHQSAPGGVAWDQVGEHRARGFFGGAHLLICGPCRRNVHRWPGSP